MLSDDHSGVHLAHTEESPARQVWRRVVIASVVLVLTVLIAPNGLVLGAMNLISRLVARRSKGDV